MRQLTKMMMVLDIGRKEVVQSSTTRMCRRDPSQWTRNANKLKRASGEEYVNKNQQIVSAKKVGHPCKCKRKCFEKIGEDKLPLKDSCSYVTKINKMPISFHLFLAMPLSGEDHKLRTI